LKPGTSAVALLKDRSTASDRRHFYDDGRLDNPDRRGSPANDRTAHLGASTRLTTFDGWLTVARFVPSVL